MKTNFLKVIINIHDGDSAGAAQGTGDSNNGGGVTTNTEIRSDVKARGQSLGLSDDLMADYQAAVDSKSENKAENKEQTENNNTEPENSKKDKFEALIKGEYKGEFDQRVQKAIGERFNKYDKQITELQNNASIDNQIIDILRNKYPDLKTDDKAALLELVKKDNDMFSKSALANGMTAEEARAKYENDRETDLKDKELETLRQEKAARELDVRFRGLAQQTQQLYPNFDLEKEMADPHFQAAVDFIAQKNAEENKKTGKNDEIFNLTQAYEMVHLDELKNEAINRAGSAAISAAAQNVIANGKRPPENVNSKGNAGQENKSIGDMSDSEFNALYDNIKSGKARIPR